MSQDAAKIRVLVVDDQPLLREGIAALIADQTDIAFVGDAPTAAKRSNSCRVCASASIVNGTVDVCSRIRAGAEIDLCVPAAMAYGKAARASWWSQV